MSDADETKNHLLNEINQLKAKIAELERRAIAHEDKLKLAIFERSPFTVWACDRNFRIVLWNKVCEKIYGVSAREAIGSDYADLFVDPVEEEESRKDCLSTIDNDVVFENFLAYDHASDGTRRTMLTNCFRIWDDEKEEFLQAEVALEISDLQLRIDEHRTLREVGIARLEQQKKLIDLRKTDLIGKLTTFYSLRLRSIEKEQDRLEEYKQSLVSQKVKPEKIAELTEDERKKIENERLAIENWRLEITSKIINSTDIKELDTIDLVTIY